MISLRHARREQRALAMGGAIVLALAVLGRGLPALIRWDGQSRVATRDVREQSARADQLITKAVAVRDSATMRGRQLIALAPLLLDGGSSSTASATLAGLVSGAAAKANVRLGSLRLAVDTSAHGVFARISVRGDGTGDVRGVSMLFSELERGPTLLAVRELSISQPDPTAPSDQIETLRVEFIVEGLSLAPHSGSGK